MMIPNFTTASVVSENITDNEDGTSTVVPPQPVFDVDPSDKVGVELKNVHPDRAIYWYGHLSWERRLNLFLYTNMRVCTLTLYRSDEPSATVDTADTDIKIIEDFLVQV